LHVWQSDQIAVFAISEMNAVFSARAIKHPYINLSFFSIFHTDASFLNLPFIFIKIVKIPPMNRFAVF
jgi:hypothetical protein